ncbi:DNA-3-methyladenine glycosylase [Fulvimarina sp. 2208YS6-2-32]|uniref:DNA-3-methyladenine glycosylase II n=1 Tax=Fulvimarina uroteuthidis TaxID=3098149 RepID=A0ABU5I4N1_9HYPH|nr:DNA-3-methyladenine glycosylase [Fulvimarina sp. 2208YS6-2-32]MDY8110338.1 DNA-3-methyladenine glycosylase [Fulvimarina sp. 2208YS6-2-32]
MNDPIRCADDIARALRHLARQDPALRPVIDAAGAVPLRRMAGGLPGLCAIIVGQQVSRASADAIFGRLEKHVDLHDHRAILAMADEDFRRVGLLRPKQRTFRHIAQACEDGDLDFDRLAQASGERAVAELVALSGVGRWSAECYLLFCLGHPNVFPAGDLALKAAVATAFGIEPRPKEKDLAAIAQRWAPRRSVAARLFWAYYAVVTKRDAMPVTGPSGTALRL